MKHKILLLEDSESLVCSFKSCAFSELEIVVTSPKRFDSLCAEEGRNYSGIFINISSFCPKVADLASRLRVLEKGFRPSIKIYGYAYQTEAEELLKSWGVVLLRPMHRDFRVDVQEALKRIHMVGLRVEECAAVRSDCNECRYNDCKGSIKGSELR